MKLTNVDTGLLKELGEFLASRTYLGMLADETQKMISEFLFLDKENDKESNRKEPIGDIFAELYCNLQLAGITPEIIRSVVQNVYQVITKSTLIIPSDAIRDRYINGKMVPEDAILHMSCLLRLYITQYNNFVRIKMEKENEK